MFPEIDELPLGLSAAKWQNPILEIFGLYFSQADSSLGLPLARSHLFALQEWLLYAGLQSANQGHILPLLSPLIPEGEVSSRNMYKGPMDKDYGGGEECVRWG